MLPLYFWKRRLAIASFRQSASRRQRRTSQQATQPAVVECYEPRTLLTTIDLASLSAAQGMTIFGADQGDNSGRSVGSAGDMNGDGYDDFVIGAPEADGFGNSKGGAGESYVIFGGPSLPPTIDLANLGSAGITIFGADGSDLCGRTLGSAGDVNGDGYSDLLIGASQADGAGNSRDQSGESYVIFGGASLPATIELAALGSAGITIFGADSGDTSGHSISCAGDVNGDGYGDLVIGAPGAAGPGNSRPEAGEAYLVFGGAFLPATIDLASLGSAGFTIFGADAGDWLGGWSIGNAGDVNGDGYGDLMIAAYNSASSGNSKPLAGETYLIFGAALFPATIDLANPGSSVVTIFGADEGDGSGAYLSSAGDVNGDGFDDLLIGALWADGSDNSQANAGESYVLFGGPFLPAVIDLANLGSAGVTIFGADAGDHSGRGVGSAGDVNGDGYDDLLIGADSTGGPFDPGNEKPGTGYVIFGGPNLPAKIELAIPGSAEITLFGAELGDSAGRGVRSAGDVNGDGFADWLISAFLSDSLENSRNNAGESYLLFGGNGFTSSVTHLGTPVAETLTGTAGADVMVGGRGNDTLIGSGGSDVLIGGQGNDILAVLDLTFRRIVGGTGFDTLRLDGSGLLLDLTSMADNRLLDIEQIDISGSGNNTLILNQREVLNLSGSSNTLFVRRDFDDVVNIGSGWTQGLTSWSAPRR